MKEFKILDVAGIEFPFWIFRGTHTAPFPPHTHDFVELEIIIGGSADHIVEGKTYRIERGDVIVIMPSFVHGLKNVHELEHYNFKFDLDKLILMETDIEKLSGFQSLFKLNPLQQYQHEYSSYMRLDEEQLSRVSMLCELMNSELLERKDGYKWVIESYFLALITYLARNFSLDIIDVSPKVQKIVETVSFIHENLTDKITLSMLSSLACLSERQYSRIFKEVYGVSPIDYVINCRITLACRMMKNTEKSLQEICMTSGFGDKVSFSRLFRSRYKITPSEYRKRLL